MYLDKVQSPSKEAFCHVIQYLQEKCQEFKDQMEHLFTVDTMSGFIPVLSFDIILELLSL